MADAQEHAIQTEQIFVDRATRRLGTVLGEVERALSAVDEGNGPGQAGHARARMLRARRAELRAAGDGVVFGRVDDEQGITRRLGRVGIPDESQDDEPLVLDWRAPLARAFYSATSLHNEGIHRRRHVRVEQGRVVAVSDEVLDPAADERSADGAEGLVGEAALLHALDERRTGRMGTAVATLQREQDEIIRSSSTGPLLVQGGPGTGKTVVALHRVAYLLFTHQRLARQGVLVLGPNRRFLEYISQVLPALGESAVVSTTLDQVLPGFHPERAESRNEARIKGNDGWQTALERHVAALEPAAVDLVLPVEGEPFTIPSARVERALRLSGGAGLDLARRRRRTFEALREVLLDQVVTAREEALAQVEEGFEDILAGVDASLARSDGRGRRTGATGLDVDGTMTEQDVDRLRALIDDDTRVAQVLQQWWPMPDAAHELRAVLGDPAALAHRFPELSEDDRAVVLAAPSPSAPSDAPLLDALLDLIGDEHDTTAAAAQPEFLSERAAGTRDWIYGHVVVDEAQELSPMQWRMVMRRAGGRSVTAVGDIDQTSAPHEARTWREALGSVWGERWRQGELTVCYRTPREVMGLTAPVLRAAGSSNTPPEAVRSSGVEPWRVRTDAPELVPAVRQAVADIAHGRPGGSIGVVTSTRLHAALLDGECDAPVLTTAEAKGLEWDAVVVVDPAGIAAEPRGWNGLYVALTRCTQELAQIDVDLELDVDTDVLPAGARDE